MRRRISPYMLTMPSLKAATPSIQLLTQLLSAIMVLLDDMEPDQTGAHPSLHVPDRSSECAGWLTVAEAVLHCTQRGLPRTPKTIRKWAARSHLAPDNADISVRREDTENGFRWSIEISSLDRKIDEELEFEARKSSEHEGTSPDASEPVPTKDTAETLAELSPDMSEPVPTGDHTAVANSGVEDELRAQLKHTQDEVQFLRDELKHRRKTDEALGSVIEAFRLNAEVTQAKILEVRSGQNRSSWADTQRHDIVPNEGDRAAE